MTWRTAAVSVALLVSATLGVTLVGGLFMFPSHATQIGSDAPDDSAAIPPDTGPATAVTAALHTIVVDDLTGVDSPTELTVATLPLVEARDISATATNGIQSVLHTPMPYPAEEEPDGDRWLPHHGLWALGFYIVGWYYWHPGGAPVFGATLVGLAVLLILDDWVSHALGIKTPGDTAFEWLMRRRAFRRMYIRLWWIIYR